MPSARSSRRDLAELDLYCDRVAAAVGPAVGARVRRCQRRRRPGGATPRPGAAAHQYPARHRRGCGSAGGCICRANCCDEAGVPADAGGGAAPSGAAGVCARLAAWRTAHFAAGAQPRWPAATARAMQPRPADGRAIYAPSCPAGAARLAAARTPRHLPKWASCGSPCAARLLLDDASASMSSAPGWPGSPLRGAGRPAAR